MSILNKFTLKINDPTIAEYYRLTYTKKIFYCGIAVTFIRLALTLFTWVTVAKNPVKYAS